MVIPGLTQRPPSRGPVSGDAPAMVAGAIPMSQAAHFIGWLIVLALVFVVDRELAKRRAN